MTKYAKVIIEFDDENTPEITIAEVLRLVQEGYTSGISPDFDFIKKVG